jgi:hypothetical protein
MFIVYIAVAVFVMTLLLAIPLFPFWKVWARLKTQHPDIWQSAGPFQPADMLRSHGLISIFIQVVIRISTDTALQQRDPLLVKWSRMSVEVMRLMPRTLASQAAYVIIFVYLAYRLTRALV